MISLRVLVLLLPILSSATGSAHGAEHELDDALVAIGDRLMIAGYASPRPGPLLVVPYVDGPLPCPATSDFLVPVASGVAFALTSNATLLRATIAAPHGGFTAFAVDAAATVRTLIMMEENAISLHRVAARVIGGSADTNDPAAPLKNGTLGVPTRIPGAGTHSLGHGAAAETQVLLDYDRSGPATACTESTPGVTDLAFARTGMGEVLAPGSLVHAIVLVDEDTPAFLPHPIGTTRLFQATRYLARPGEDAAAVAAGLDARPEAATLVPLIATGSGLVIVAGVAWSKASVPPPRRAR